MSTIFKRGPASVNSNLTPMIDVTFLLIVFFVLVAQITNTRVAPEVELPQPEDSVSEVPEEERRLVLNIIPAPQDSLAIAYRLNAREFPATTAGLDELTEHLRAAREADENLQLDFRADRATPYRDIYPVVQAVMRAGVSRLNVSVVIDSEDHRSARNARRAEEATR